MWRLFVNCKTIRTRRLSSFPLQRQGHVSPEKSQSLQNLILLPRKEDQSFMYFASYVHVAALPPLYFEWTLCSILGRGPSYVKHECEMLFIDHHCEMKWERVMIADRHILASRPDRLLFDKPNKTAELIDIATLRG